MATISYRVYNGDSVGIPLQLGFVGIKTLPTNPLTGTLSYSARKVTFNVGAGAAGSEVDSNYSMTGTATQSNYSFNSINYQVNKTVSDTTKIAAKYANYDHTYTSLSSVLRYEVYDAYTPSFNLQELRNKYGIEVGSRFTYARGIASDVAGGGGGGGASGNPQIWY
jgi:hypothetical protein